MSEVSFTNRRESRATDDVPRIGVGLLGYGFMGKAHSNAYRTLAYMTWPPPLVPELVAVAGRTEEAVAEAAGRYRLAGPRPHWPPGGARRPVGPFSKPRAQNPPPGPTAAPAQTGEGPGR